MIRYLILHNTCLIFKASFSECNKDTSMSLHLWKKKIIEIFQFSLNMSAMYRVLFKLLVNKKTILSQ
jgi:hypothetical protein